ncbi:MAG: rhomboid family intramembrane serine protease [Victivallales bacterium]|nr:rhomboid family intramembrane serine protease [Victivallales bacterium]
MRVNVENTTLVGCLVMAAGFLMVFPCVGDSLRLHTDGESVSFVMQLFTCHLVHWTWAHLFYDVICFAALGMLLNRRELLACFLLAALAVSSTVLLFHPELSSYCGLSGVNCALYAFFAVKVGRERNGLWGTVMIVAILLKTLAEILAGHTFFASTGFIPVHSAHLAGIIAGMLCGVLPSWGIVPCHPKKVQST